MLPFRHPLGLALPFAGLLALTGCGQDLETGAQVQARTDPPDAATKPSGSVWVVDAPETGGRLFLCGTIHILREEDYPLAPAYEAAYAASDRLVFELPPGAGDGPAMAARMRALATYPAHASLKEALAPATWAGVQKWAESRDTGPAVLDRFRPWFVSLLITSAEYTALGAKPQLGVDQHFEARAKRDRKPAEGLETVEFQLQLFAKLTPEEQHEMLEQTLAEVSTLPEEYEDMITSWKQGDLDALGDMLFREAVKFPALMNIFLYDRNQAWMDRLEVMLSKGEKVMLLVGTGHFAGEKGLIPLLKARGYTVRHYEEVKAAP